MTDINEAIVEEDRRREAHREAIALRRFGRAVNPDAWVRTELWAYTLDAQGAETGFVARVHGRTLGEVAEDLRAAFKTLATFQCSKCDRDHEPKVEPPDDAPPEARAAYSAWLLAPTCEACGARLNDYLSDFLEEGFSVVRWYKYRGVEGDKIEWPEHVRWVSCYAVTGGTGGSEGHYVHVDLHLDKKLDGSDLGPGDLRPVFPIIIAKTFRGMPHAQKVAAKFTEFFGA